MLSICVTFCDKDFKHIPNLINHISKVVFVDYEIILIDNREKDNGDTELIYGNRVYPTGGNNGCFIGRQEAAKHVKGNYVWYIDADDLVFKVPKDIQKTLDSEVYDEILFRFEDSNYKSKYSVYKNSLLKSDADVSDVTYAFDDDLMPLWNKFIKADLFKTILNIKWPYKQVLQEDALLSEYFFTHSEKIGLYNKSLYYYNTKVADAQGDITSIEQIDRLLTGIESLYNFTNTLFNGSIPYNVRKFITEDQTYYLFKDRISKIKSKRFRNKVIRFVFNKKGLYKPGAIKGLNDIGLKYFHGLIF